MIFLLKYLNIILFKFFSFSKNFFNHKISNKNYMFDYIILLILYYILKFFFILLYYYYLIDFFLYLFFWTIFKVKENAEFKMEKSLFKPFYYLLLTWHSMKQQKNETRNEAGITIPDDEEITRGSSARSRVAL